MRKSSNAFRTISEVAEWVEEEAHVLRFWESKFFQIRPVKRAGGRRYYRPGDMLLLGGIKRLLHEDGMTIKGVQKILKDEGTEFVTALSRPLEDSTPEDAETDTPDAETPVTETAATPPEPVATQTEAPARPDEVLPASVPGPASLLTHLPGLYTRGPVLGANETRVRALIARIRSAHATG